MRPFCSRLSPERSEHAIVTRHSAPVAILLVPRRAPLILPRLYGTIDTMISNLLKKIVGTKNERELKRIQPLIEEINSHEQKMRALSDEELKGMTPLFKGRLENGEEVDAVLPEAFAAVRERPEEP